MRHLLIVAVLALVVAGCGGKAHVSTSAAVAANRAASVPVALPKRSHLLLDAAEPLSWAYAGDRSLYFSYSSPVGEHVGEDYEMMRVDTATGGVLARCRFTTAPVATTLAGGSLWVTTTAGSRVTLWRLNPRSLVVRSKQTLPSSPANEGIAGSLAVAGAQLWVGTGLLDEVSLHTGHVERVIAPSHRGPVQVEADQTGRFLLSSQGYEHPTYIVRLNPETAAPISQLMIPKSDTQPSLGGIVDGGAWIENTVGSHTSVWRISLRTMKTTKTNTWAAAGRISVRTIDGVLWVDEPVGQNNLNYCANPVTGRPRFRLPLLRGNSVFLTADARSFFYTDVPINAHKVRLESAPISPACTS